VVPDAVNVDELARRWRPHTVVGADAVPGRELAPKPVDPGSPAYVLFTSGSTGHPKGVLVAHQNVAALVDASVERFEIAETDRFSQMFDTTFDLSVFDMFVAWERGACVVCPPPKALLSPARFVRENELTVWFSVPSVALFAKRLGALAPGSFPSLRWSLFCGEPLPAELAATWAAAGPQATLENLYGPTEATVFCSAYRWDPSTSPAECVNGIVPIGAPVPGTTMVVVDEELREVDAGCDGELVVGGRQVALGYLDEEERTAAAFVRLPARRGVYYRTGDRVRRPERDGPIAFLGRRDEQVKVNGHRVELAEVEAALREAAQTEAAVALAWPRTEVGASGITAFVSDTQVTPVSMRRALAERLPPYMVPREITVLHRFPLTANGKLDRSALLQRLEAGT
ncbi:MAG TPA: AMP-binding protein, partial [Gaiellaceae bacterium]|nr:AMP-binding protein [Gaiellaceae bacterium]